jgi:enamine deaminase RidA (YjgF/YER057c/UK114 family)
MTMRTFASTLVAVAALGTVATAAANGGVVRHKNPGGNSPMAQAVEVPPGATTLYFSGMIPLPADKDAAKDSRAMWGDTKSQSINILSRLKENLARHDATLGDVVKMQVFLVGDPQLGGKMDFAGFNEAYRQFFGTTDQPEIPARSVMQVAALANPMWLVEIEVVVVKAAK